MEPYEIIEAQNKVIGIFCGKSPEIEYYVGHKEKKLVQYSPKNFGEFDWHPLQKKECDRYVSESRSKGRLEDGYETIKKEWYPFYDTDWRELMAAWAKFRDLKIANEEYKLHHLLLKNTIAPAICYGTIEIAYKELFTGITWYNEKYLKLPQHA